MSEIMSLVYLAAALFGTALSAWLGWPDTEPFCAKKFVTSMLIGLVPAATAAVALPTDLPLVQTLVAVFFSGLGGAGLDVIINRATKK